MKKITNNPNTASQRNVFPAYILQEVVDLTLIEAEIAYLQTVIWSLILILILPNCQSDQAYTKNGNPGFSCIQKGKINSRQCCTFRSCPAFHQQTLSLSSDRLCYQLLYCCSATASRWQWIVSFTARVNCAQTLDYVIKCNRIIAIRPMPIILSYKQTNANAIIRHFVSHTYILSRPLHWHTHPCAKSPESDTSPLLVYAIMDEPYPRLYLPRLRK